MRLLLKLSGEVLGGRAGLGLDPEALSHFADTIAALAQKHEVAIVTGGGNIMRGKTASGLDRAKADQIGMMATVVNCMTLAEYLVARKCNATAMSSVASLARHVKPLLHHRLGGRTTRPRTPLRPTRQSHKSRRHLRRRPRQTPRRQTLRPHPLRRRHRAKPGRHGPHRHGPVPRQQTLTTRLLRRRFAPTRRRHRRRFAFDTRLLKDARAAPPNARRYAAGCGYFALRAQYASAFVALFRPLGSIRALGGYFALRAQYAAFLGLRYAYPCRQLQRRSKTHTSTPLGYVQCHCHGSRLRKSDFSGRRNTRAAQLQKSHIVHRYAQRRHRSRQAKILRLYKTRNYQRSHCPTRHDDRLQRVAHRSRRVAYRARALTGAGIYRGRR